MGWRLPITKLPIKQKETEGFVRILTCVFGLDFLPTSQLKILKHLALQGPEPKEPQTKYQIQKNTKINHASVCEAVDTLLKLGALEGERIGKTRTGQPMTKYSLTLSGVGLALSRCDQKNGLVDVRIYPAVASKWSSEEPILLGKYHYLTTKLGEDVAKAILFSNAWHMAGESDWEIDDLRVHAIDEMFQRVRETIDQFEANQGDKKAMDSYRRIFGETDPIAVLDALLNAFTEDADLNKYLRMYLDEVAARAKCEEDWGNFLKNRPAQQSALNLGSP